MLFCGVRSDFAGCAVRRANIAGRYRFLCPLAHIGVAGQAPAFSGWSFDLIGHNPGPVSFMKLP